ncbi:MAG: isoaspartyl peptidase/L-asparaginase [Acidibacter sp.]|nr:isoaspartyl peptidase/L-asparaginase [Acidibacter sp.]
MTIPAVLLLTSIVAVSSADAEIKRPLAIAIHGGAGVIAREQLGPDDGASYRAGLAEALDAGYAVLEQGGSSLDAVTTAVRILEDNPLFNAGRGAHVMLYGAGAEEFASSRGFEFVPNEFFITPQRKQQLERVLQGRTQPRNELSGLGTVGAVAIDSSGNLAAATSTGGMTNKRWGRIGDAPIIGAGTYANNASCAVSATGHGEYFIRSVVAYDVCALMEYKGYSLDRAATEVVKRKLVERGGEGGIIAVDRAGNVALEFNSPGMFRGMRDSAGRREIAIYEK